MTAGGSVVNMEEFDDVDSFVELIAENISHDPKLIKETHNDAHSPIEIRSIKLSNVVLYAGSKEKPDLAPASISAIIAKPRLTNTSFQFEDYSSPAFDPPDPLVC